MRQTMALELGATTCPTASEEVGGRWPQGGAVLLLVSLS